MTTRLPQLEKRISDLEGVAENVVQLAKGYAHGSPAGELPLRGEEWYRGARLLVDQNFSGLADFDYCYAACFGSFIHT